MSQPRHMHYAAGPQMTFSPSSHVMTKSARILDDADRAGEPRRTAVRALHATQQNCLPGYRQRQIAVGAGRCGVLLAPRPRLP